MSDVPSDPSLPPRQGKSWEVEEDRRLYDAFVGGQTIGALASAHQRSTGGIRSRLKRLCLIDEFGDAVKPPPPFVAPDRRRPLVAPRSGAPRFGVDEEPITSGFSVRTGDGWVVEIRSNRLLSRSLVDRLTAMLHGTISEDQP